MVPISRPDRLLRNNGDGSFSDVSEQAGIRGTGFGLSAIWWGYDDDGLPDLYVANDLIDPSDTRRYKLGSAGVDARLVAWQQAMR